MPWPSAAHCTAISPCWWTAARSPSALLGPPAQLPDAKGWSRSLMTRQSWPAARRACAAARRCT
jgi:hypothetical protein